MSNIEELEKLADLKKKGIISKEEFEEQKQKLLAENSYDDSKVSTSPKSRVAFAVLGFFLGWLGIHNFYLGRKVQAIFQLLFGALWLIGSFLGIKLLYIISGLYIMASPLWVGLNLLITKKDGKGRLLSERGKGATSTFGMVTIMLGGLFVILLVVFAIIFGKGNVSF